MNLLDGIEISSEKEDIICYSYDASYAKGVAPQFVAWPKNTEEISKLIKWASNKGLKIVPRGAGTGMSGGAIPIDSKSIVISLEKMNQILDINLKNFIVTVEAGVINGELQKELIIYELFYPPDPASLDYCTIGGNVATNAGGPTAIKYGVTRNYVMELEVVLSNGNILTFGGKTTKRVVGYEIKELFIGSEGTLGIISKVTLRVLPQPEDIITLLISFPNIENAGLLIPQILHKSIIPRAVEFLDNSCLQIIRETTNIELIKDTEAMILLELDGEVTSIKREAERVIDIAKKLKGDIKMATDFYSRQNLWKARRCISPTILKMTDKKKINLDITVPVENLSKALVSIKEISNLSKIPAVCFGHAGDGNIHVNILINPDEINKGFEVAKKIFELTVSLQGAISGEHGVGVTKKQYIEIQLSKRQIEIMKALKRVFDPKDIMNPGKIF
ncbi:MAG: FAD-linked oxidase C-terminal domain-containing protein [Thermodesulfovibrionaceae bacterium]